MMEFSKLQRKLRLNKKLCNFNYRGERTFIVLPGINHANYDMGLVPGLEFYEERMLFFLFLLRYKRTKIVYITSKNFNEKLFDYYLDLISANRRDFNNKKKRFVHIEIDNDNNVALVQKILNDEKAIKQIRNTIAPKVTVLRCYNATKLERELALKLNIPIFSSLEKHDFVGTKSGGRKVFKLSKTNVIPGFEGLGSTEELYDAIIKLIKNYPESEKLVIKLDSTASGSGNALFKVKEFIATNSINLEKIKNQELKEKIKNGFKDFLIRQEVGPSFEEYLNLFNKMGGIVELFIDQKIKYSPSVQAFINAGGKASIISTHEQILGGKGKQEYLGCSFPSLASHRKQIIKEARKITDWMVKKRMMGNFGIDFVVVYDRNGKMKIYPIEINLRKGGTTHPFRIAYFLTGARYNQAKGLLMCGKVPIYYSAMDLVRSPNYYEIKADKLVELIHDSKISFNKNTKKGVLVYMPGVVENHGFFGAICIGHSDREVKRIYNQMIKLINSNINLLKK
ncbi:MAG: ATP-grasp domain-containing protein [Patescibacteria group bacterium]|nr:ATP-grasp domain-containing protein [Patescibacteria group bacterium]